MIKIILFWRIFLCPSLKVTLHSKLHNSNALSLCPVSGQLYSAVQCSATRLRMRRALVSLRVVTSSSSRNLTTTTSLHRASLTSAVKTNFYNSEQEALQESTQRVVEEVINQDWELWEKEKIFPGKKVFKKFGDAGLLGIHRPTEYGGQGLGYKYHVAFLEALGHAKR